jgi:hypothetical protein
VRHQIGRLWLKVAALSGMLAIMGGVAATAAPPAPQFSCDTLAKEVRVRGAKSVVDRLWNAQGADNWDHLLDQIEAGRPACIRLAKLLKPGTDAGSGETLQISLSLALKTNPAEVLSLGDKVVKVSGACQDNQIEPTAEQHRAFLALARASVSKITEPDLMARRNACLKYLNQ